MTLFFIVTFAFFLGAGAAFAVLRSWALDMSSMLPHSFSTIGIGISSLTTVVPLAVYAAVLSSFAYSSRHDIPRFPSSAIIFILSAAALFAFSSLGVRLSAYTATDLDPAAANAMNANPVRITRFEDGSSVVMTGHAAVVAVNDVPLRIADMKEAPGFGLRSAPVDPFAPSLSVPSSLEAFADVFTATGRRLSEASAAGTMALLAYAAALSLLMTSFRFLAGSTKWPFADFMLCAIALWGVASYDEFLTSSVVRRLIATATGPIPSGFAVPAALAATGAAVSFCAFLAAIAEGRRKGNA